MPNHSWQFTVAEPALVPCFAAAAAMAHLFLPLTQTCPNQKAGCCTKIDTELAEDVLLPSTRNETKCMSFCQQIDLTACIIH